MGNRLLAAIKRKNHVSCRRGNRKKMFYLLLRKWAILEDSGQNWHEISTWKFTEISHETSWQNFVILRNQMHEIELLHQLWWVLGCLHTIPNKTVLTILPSPVFPPFKSVNSFQGLDALSKKIKDFLKWKNDDFWAEFDLFLVWCGVLLRLWISGVVEVLSQTLLC